MSMPWWPWMKLAACPGSYFGIPIIRSRNEIIIVPESHDVAALLRYDAHKDQYVEWIAYPEDFYTANHTSAIDTDRNIIYIVGRTKILTINLKTEQCKLISMKSLHTNTPNAKLFDPTRYDLSSQPTSIVLGGKLNIFTGNHRIIYDDIRNQISVHNINFGCYQLIDHGMVHIKSQNRLLYVTAESLNIRSFNYENNTLCLIPKARFDDAFSSGHPPSCVISKDERYIIIFGMHCNGEIYIFDIKMNTVRYSNVYTPDTDCRWRAYITSNTYTDNVIVAGYLGCHCISNKMDSLSMPMDLIQLIILFYAQEDVHLMSLEYGEHFVLPLWDILQ